MIRCCMFYTWDTSGGWAGGRRHFALDKDEKLFNVITRMPMKQSVPLVNLCCFP
jgi:muconolactone delta-isomerase